MQDNMAEKILNKLQNRILKKYYMLTPIVSEMELCPVSQDCIFETDGIHIFYQPKQICRMAKNKEWNELVHRYMHIILHGVLYHYVDYTKYSVQSLANAVFDIEIDWFLQKLENRQEVNFSWRHLEEILEEQGAGGLYAEALRSKELRRDIYRRAKLVSMDCHENWQPRKHPQEQEEEKPAAGGGITSEQGVCQRSKEELSSFWSNLVDCCVEGAAGKNGDGIFQLFGSGSAGTERTTSKAQEEALDYEEVLKAVLQERACESDPERFDRDLYALGMEMYEDVALLEPSEEGEQFSVGTIAIAIDTSGSCDGEIVRRFLTQTEGILQTLSNIKYEEIVIFQADEEICNEQHIQAGDVFPDFMQVKLYGFGGTDFRPVFQRVEQMNKVSPVDLLIYLTDAMGVFPEKESPVKTYFVIPHYQNLQMNVPLQIPEWIECLSI